MAKIELSIHADYAPKWGKWEGIRDLVQNTVDGHDKGHAMTIYRKDDGVIILKNDGVSLPMEAFLLGFSTKRDDDSQRGQHGEGLKLAMLALVRAGIPVKIRTGSLSIRPQIGPSKSFGCDVLSLVTRRCSHVDSLTVSVGSPDATIPNMEWLGYKSRFLFLREVEKIETEFGDILLGEEEKGKLYTGGIFVCDYAGLSHGFNIPIKLNRDRSIPEEFSVSWGVSAALSSALENDLMPSREVVKAVIESNAARYFGARSLYSGHEKLGNALKGEYGDDVVLVTTQDQSNVVANAGKTPVKVSDNAIEGFPAELGFVEFRKAAIHGAKIEQIDLKPCEQKSLATLNRYLPAPVIVVTGSSEAVAYSNGRVMVEQSYLYNDIYDIIAECAAAMIHSHESVTRIVLAIIYAEKGRPVPSKKGNPYNLPF